MWVSTVHGRMVMVCQYSIWKDSQRQTQKTPDLSTKLAENILQGMAKITAQVHYQGFIVRYKFGNPTYCR